MLLVAPDAQKPVCSQNKGNLQAYNPYNRKIAANLRVINWLESYKVKQNDKNKDKHEKTRVLKKASKGKIVEQPLHREDEKIIIIKQKKNSKKKLKNIENNSDTLISGSFLGGLLTSSLKSNQVEINTDTKTQKTVARLREPRDLFTLPREPECSQETARWPSECQFSRSTSRSNVLSPQPAKEHDLKFESRFESGNLSKAIKITEVYYQLYLRTDLYTNRHCQWFYFMVENMKKNTQYRKDEEDPECTYTLTFQLEFPYDDDCCFLAHSYPYTYTNLQDYLYKLQNHPIKSLHTRLRLLCKTLAGNNVYYLTVTAPQSSEDSLKKKKAVVISARVHPGETPASYMMKGLIDFITGDAKAAQELRERFIFKLIPMLNPDGVIVGNSRCSLTGRDLNRQFRTVIRETYPPVWHTKVLIKRLMEDCGIALYCDLHAHSSKHNVFIYGCENKRNPDRRLQEQVFPLMLHKNSSDKFSFENCKFRIQKNKEGTGRVVMWMLGIENSYTLEASFAGSTLGMRSCSHFNTSDYEAMGRSFCETLLDFLDDAPVKSKLRTKILQKLQKEGSSADEPANVSVSDYSSDDGEITDSSDDEKKKREDFFLTAPPPSPETVREKSRTYKIPTATIDLDSGELHSSGDEKGRQSPQRSKPDTSKPTTIRLDFIDMPPELVITSTQGSDLSVFERLYKSAQQSKEVSKSPTRRDSCRRCSPGRYGKKSYRY
ncbi:unnamed protein product [Nezara viridula]|uniref:Peptidase M14 domain-containing protein n=1 Tax=Nezara viridula TaxID=85310 RepID=A0A9P0MS47_NEZVI|nr:unnamed protein product [Nezara viridula]